MVYSLYYTRPDYVPHSRGASSGASINIVLSGNSDDRPPSVKSMPGNLKGIPDELSFDRIINGGCCPVRCSKCSHLSRRSNSCFSLALRENSSTISNTSNAPPKTSNSTSGSKTTKPASMRVLNLKRPSPPNGHPPLPKPSERTTAPY
jgi:hypothetical protein